MITLIGSEGSMGTRYKAILKFLGEDFECFDVNDSITSRAIDTAKKSDGIIIATPTETHCDYLGLFNQANKPILCEKPLSKDKQELVKIIELCRSGLNLTMMLQYKFYDSLEHNGDSFYNYFRHGKDGLAWDCIQILALARGNVQLAGTSPVWRCRLNGMDLSLDRMDEAYLWAVTNWLSEPGEKIEDLVFYHKKVFDYLEKH